MGLGYSGVYIVLSQGISPSFNSQLHAREPFLSPRVAHFAIGGSSKGKV